MAESSLLFRVKNRIAFILRNQKHIGLIAFGAFSSGCVVTIIAIAMILLYANHGNHKSIKTILFSIFVQVQLLLTRRRLRHQINDGTLANKTQFRVSPKVVDKCINTVAIYSDKKKYPFIRILPQTQPSNRFQFYDSLLFGEKGKAIERMKKPWTSRRITAFRKVCAESEAMTAPLYPDSTNIKIEKLTDHQIECHWIAYNGSSIENGIIMGLHGGGYFAGSPRMQYALCSLLSKLTGCVCISVDYRLAPEHPLPAAVDDVVNVYQYLLNEKGISPTKIAVMGESAGGGLSLLFLQYLQRNEMPQPACCWVNSPWTSLESESGAWKRNSEYDAILTHDPKNSNMAPDMIVGKVDIDGNKIDGVDIDRGHKTVSPLYGEWKGLCPLYFMVGATEMLVDDTVRASIKAHDAGVEVKVDIEPHLFHVWCLFQRAFVEAHYCAVRASDFILSHLAKPQIE